MTLIHFLTDRCTSAPDFALRLSNIWNRLENAIISKYVFKTPESYDTFMKRVVNVATSFVEEYEAVYMRTRDELKVQGKTPCLPLLQTLAGLCFASTKLGQNFLKVSFSLINDV